MTAPTITPDAAALAADPVDPALVARLLLWIIAALTTCLLLWAALAQVDEVATASGRVVPSRQLQIVSNLEGGTVKAILVRAGARVRAGQQLLQLDGAQFNAEFARTSATFKALSARAARLQGEVADHAPAFSPGLIASAPEIVATERGLYYARQSDLLAATATEQARLDQAERALGQAEVEAGMRVEAAALTDSEVAVLAPLVTKGIEPRMAMMRALSAQTQARGAAAGSALAVRRARSAVAEARSGLRSVRERYRSQSADALATTRADLAGQGVTLPALQDRVTRTQVRAPIAGTVNRVLVATIGGTVRPFEPLVEIVPLNEALVVEAEIRPADIAFIRVGQRASVKLTAYDYSIYGALDGVVERISPDAIVDERTGESHFTIRVRTRQSSLQAQDGTPLAIGAGMTAAVDVLGHKRSVLSYVLTPIAKLRDNAFREK